MRWLFFALVAVNLVYPAWKLMEASRVPKSAQTSVAPVRTGDQLVLLREAEAAQSGLPAEAAQPTHDPRVVPDDGRAAIGQPPGEPSASSSEKAESPVPPVVESPVPEPTAGMQTPAGAGVPPPGEAPAAAPSGPEPSE